MRGDRLLSILLLLQARGKLTTGALAGELAVSRRTILRDIDALSIAGVPIYTDGGHGGGVSLDDRYRTTLTGLKEAEVRALFVQNNPQLLGEIGLNEAATTTRRKLDAALPVQHRATVSAMQQRIYIDNTRWWHSAPSSDFWPALQRAVFEDTVIRMRYQAYGGEVAEREIEPYSLVSKSGAWYLIGKHHGTLRTYRVERMVDLVTTGSQFERDLAFDLPTHWHSQLDTFRATFTEYTFVAEVHPDHMGFVRWIGPGRHMIEAHLADGWQQVRFYMESEEMAVIFAFGLGPQVRIVTPAELRTALIVACQQRIDLNPVD